VEAALARGATSVAVATGRYGAAELAAAGAHLVLPDLTDTRLLFGLLGATA
jgi:phosphoglycolate phosphatase-like HAD superfamily hydrolase